MTGSPVTLRPAVGRSLRTNVRVFLIGGAIAYRALFNWLRPSIYIPTMLGSPLFQILFFAHLGRFSGNENDAFFVVGNAVQSCSMAGIYGATMAIGNERWMGTLMPLLATPTNRLALFLGRALPYIVNGLFVSLFGLAADDLLLRFDLTLAALPQVLIAVFVTASSCSALGLLLGSIRLRSRDVFFISNLMYFPMLLLCNVNIPIDALPPPLEAVGRVLPQTHR